jgi:hypothetical protein
MVLGWAAPVLESVRADVLCWRSGRELDTYELSVTRNLEQHDLRRATRYRAKQTVCAAGILKNVIVVLALLTAGSLKGDDLPVPPEIALVGHTSCQIEQHGPRWKLTVIADYVNQAAHNGGKPWVSEPIFFDSKLKHGLDQGEAEANHKCLVWMKKIHDEQLAANQKLEAVQKQKEKQ